MCQYMIQIAEGVKERALFRCEHGTFHLTWGSGVFSLTLDELSGLSMLLVDVRQGEAKASKKSGIRIQQRMSAEGVVFFELWIADVGIRLLAKDFDLLEKLVSETMAWIEVRPPFSPEKHIQAAELLANMVALPTTLKSLSWN